MYSANFDYYRPQTLQEAVALLNEKQGARIIAGGHSLLPAMKLRLATPQALVDISRVPGLTGIDITRESLEIGALATHATIAASGEIRRACPLLSEVVEQIGDQQVRNRGTIGGSLAYADPGADYPTALVALGATIHVTSASGDRSIPAEQFFTGMFTTSLKRGEVVTHISVPAMKAGTGSAYLKHRHPASSYAVVGVAALVTMQGQRCEMVSLVAGGLADKPIRCVAAENALKSQLVDGVHLKSAADQVRQMAVNPISDHYASGEYRQHLAAVMSHRALATAAERARG